MRYLLFVCILLSSSLASAQSADRVANEIDINAGIGQSRGTFSAGLFRTWRFGQERRLGIGAGLRYTGFAGTNLYYITAPARLTSGSTGPLVIFRDNVAENIDSVLLKTPLVSSLNVVININYRFSSRLMAGFNIDLVGVSLGKKTSANYINGFEGRNTTATPALFNVLLISDNDRGSLNSELYLRYSLNETWALKAGGQFLFTEYITASEVQTFPEPNDRFRNKSLLFTAGVTYKF